MTHNYCTWNCTSRVVLSLQIPLHLYQVLSSNPIFFAEWSSSHCADYDDKWFVFSRQSWIPSFHPWGTRIVTAAPPFSWHEASLSSSIFLNWNLLVLIFPLMLPPSYFEPVAKACSTISFPYKQLLDRRQEYLYRQLESGLKMNQNMDCLYVIGNQ